MLKGGAAMDEEGPTADGVGCAVGPVSTTGYAVSDGGKLNLVLDR